MDTNHSDSENFSLTQEGLLYKAMVRLRLHNKQGTLALVCLFVSWVPLVIITAIEGTLYSGTDLPFLKDVAMQARILVALPMLILIKVAIDSKVTQVTKYLSNALMPSDERDRILGRVLRRSRRLAGSTITDIILLAIVIVATIGFVKTGVYNGLENGTNSWMIVANDADKKLSVAGHWAVMISIPLFQFNLLRWMWRYLVWMLLLLRFSKGRLNLLATHPDRAGGLGIIMIAQKNFNLIFVAVSTVISGELIARLVKDPNSFISIRNEGIAYIVISIFFILIPLFFFTGQLVKLKNEGLLRLSNLGATMSRRFESDWLKDSPLEEQAEEKPVDPSMLFDYSGQYDLLQELRIIPTTVRDVIGLAIVLFVPFIPILFVHFSVAELLKRITSILA